MVIRHAILVALALAPAGAMAADRFTCKVIEKTLEATDRGLADLAAGQGGGRSASGIAVYAREAPAMAERYSARDPLPDTVLAALAAMAEAATTHVSVVEAAPDLLEHGLIVQEAMPQICPRSDVADLARHGL